MAYLYIPLLFGIILINFQTKAESLSHEAWFFPQKHPNRFPSPHGNYNPWKSGAGFNKINTGVGHPKIYTGVEYNKKHTGKNEKAKLIEQYFHNKTKQMDSNFGKYGKHKTDIDVHSQRQPTDFNINSNEDESLELTYSQPSDEVLYEEYYEKQFPNYFYNPILKMKGKNSAGPHKSIKSKSDYDKKYSIPYGVFNNYERNKKIYQSNPEGTTDFNINIREDFEDSRSYYSKEIQASGEDNDNKIFLNLKNIPTNFGYKSHHNKKDIRGEGIPMSIVDNLQNEVSEERLNSGEEPTDNVELRFLQNQESVMKSNPSLVNTMYNNNNGLGQNKTVIDDVVPCIFYIYCANDMSSCLYEKGIVSFNNSNQDWPIEYVETTYNIKNNVNPDTNTIIEANRKPDETYDIIKITTSKHFSNKKNPNNSDSSLHIKEKHTNEKNGKKNVGVEDKSHLTISADKKKITKENEEVVSENQEGQETPNTTKPLASIYSVLSAGDNSSQVDLNNIKEIESNKLESQTGENGTIHTPQEQPNKNSIVENPEKSLGLLNNPSEVLPTDHINTPPLDEQTTTLYEKNDLPESDNKPEEILNLGKDNGNDLTENRDRGEILTEGPDNGENSSIIPENGEKNSENEIINQEPILEGTEQETQSPDLDNKPNYINSGENQLLLNVTEVVNSIPVPPTDDTALNNIENSVEVITTRTDDPETIIPENSTDKSELISTTSEKESNSNPYAEDDPSREHKTNQNKIKKKRPRRPNRGRPGKKHGTGKYFNKKWRPRYPKVDKKVNENELSLGNNVHLGNIKIVQQNRKRKKKMHSPYGSFNKGSSAEDTFHSGQFKRPRKPYYNNQYPSHDYYSDEYTDVYKEPGNWKYNQLHTQSSVDYVGHPQYDYYDEQDELGYKKKPYGNKYKKNIKNIINKTYPKYDSSEEQYQFEYETKSHGNRNKKKNKVNRNTYNQKNKLPRNSGLCYNYLPPGIQVSVKVGPRKIIQGPNNILCRRRLGTGL